MPPVISPAPPLLACFTVPPPKCPMLDWLPYSVCRWPWRTLDTSRTEKPPSGWRSKSTLRSSVSGKRAYDCCKDCSRGISCSTAPSYTVKAQRPCFELAHCFPDKDTSQRPTRLLRPLAHRDTRRPDRKCWGGGSRGDRWLEPLFFRPVAFFISGCPPRERERERERRGGEGCAGKGVRRVMAVGKVGGVG